MQGPFTFKISSPQPIDDSTLLSYLLEPSFIANQTSSGRGEEGKKRLNWTSYSSTYCNRFFGHVIIAVDSIKWSLEQKRCFGQAYPTYTPSFSTWIHHWIWLGLTFHIEHHCFPRTPWYNLHIVHKDIKRVIASQPHDQSKNFSNSDEVDEKGDQEEKKEDPLIDVHPRKEKNVYA